MNVEERCFWVGFWILNRKGALGNAEDVFKEVPTVSCSPFKGQSRIENIDRVELPFYVAIRSGGCSRDASAPSTNERELSESKNVL